MRIAIDISPLKTGNFLKHSIRGSGFYLENLNKSLKKFFPNNDYVFFTNEESVPNDVSVVHYPYFEPFFLTLPLVNKNKFLVTVHDLTPLVFPEHFPPGIKGKLKWFLQKRKLKKASLIITDSECSKKDIANFTGIKKEKIKVIYLSAGEEFRQIEDKKNLDIIKTKYNLPDKFVLYVGDATWNKNLPALFKAIGRENLPFVVVGKTIADESFDRKNPWNRDLTMIQDFIKTSKNISPLGFVPTDDLVSIYNLATVLVMPSLYEGFGLPILEAMNCGCPVVVSKEGSIEEIAGSAAEYVDASSVDSIARGIKKVFLDSDLQKKLSEKGRVQSAKFSWEKAVKETMESYEKVALLK